MHVCDFTTAQISSKYVHKQHTDHSENKIEFNQFENRDVPYGRTHAQGTGGSSPTHGELLEVADHSRCSHTRADVTDVDDGSGGLLSQLSVRAEDWDGENSGATQ